MNIRKLNRRQFAKRAKATVAVVGSAFKGLRSAVDESIYFVAPVWGAKRKATRRRFEFADTLAEAQVKRLRNQGFDGAREDRLRSERWIGQRWDEDFETDLTTLRNRSRMLYKDDSIGGAVDTNTTHTVGCGFTPQSRIDFNEVELPEAEVEDLHNSLEKAFKRWAKRADRNRRRSFWQVVRLAARNWKVDGEAFVVLSDVGDADSDIPLALEVIDSSRVATPLDRITDPLIKLGIEKNSKGKIVAYHILKPDTVAEYERVEAWRVCHVFEPMFAEQTRGLPWMHRVLNDCRDKKDFSEATVVAAQVQACYSAFIKNSELPAGDAAIGAAAGQFSNGQRWEELEPGSIRYLGPGEDAVFANPSQPGSGFGSIMEWIHRKIAGGINFCYEMLAKNWSGVSFAGGRLVLQDARVDWSCQQRLITDLLLEPVWNRFVEEAIAVGLVDIDASTFRKQRAAYCEHEWTPPKWPFSITPREEVEAALMKIDGNLGTAEDEIAAMGGDADDVFKRRAKELQKQRDLKILPAEKAATEAQIPNEEAETENDREMREEEESAVGR